MTQEISFSNPKTLGCVVLGATQVNKILPFETTEGVFINDAFVKVYRGEDYRGRKLLITYTVGNGLVLSGTNTQGTSKTLSLSLNGPDYVGVAPPDQTLKAECSFFTAGDIEIIFDLIIT